MADSPDVTGRLQPGANAVGIEVTNGGSEANFVSIYSMLEPGDEVITPTFSFFATAGCVTRLGAVPKLVEILKKAPAKGPMTVQFVDKKDPKSPFRDQIVHVAMLPEKQIGPDQVEVGMKLLWQID